MSEKFCVNCTKYRSVMVVGHAVKLHQCEAGKYYNLVTGAVEYAECEAMREEVTLCGPQGRWFQTKEATGDYVMVEEK